MNHFNLKLKIKNTIENKLKNLVNELRGVKLVITLAIKFIKTIHQDETKHSTFYLNSKAETVIHRTDIDSVFESIYCTIMAKIQKYHEEASGLTTYLVINVNVSKCKSLGGSSYIKLPKELTHSRNGLINI